MSAEGPRRKIRRVLLWALAGLGSAILVGGAVFLVFARAWWSEATQMADAHRGHRVSHPGWSFPARVVSEAVALTEPPAKLVAEAQARGYRSHCPEPRAGEYCERNGKVVPRAGEALEPVLLGWLIGPDGELREHLPISDAPKQLLDAILAAEDRDFREHRGVNAVALLRAAFANAREGGYAQGGSTLTMQMVRAMVGRREKTLARKAREAVMALAVDRHLGKEGVLQMYLDSPYLGQRGGFSVCGFEAASKHYFGKSARELSLAESATLAAILPAPRRFAPDRFPDRAKARRDRLLRAMAELYGYDVEGALAEPVSTAAAAPLAERFPSYLSAVRGYLEARLPRDVLYGSGLTVTAGVDVAMQVETERTLPERTRYLESLVGRRQSPLQSAGVLLDVETGRIRALWGGGATSTDFNRATMAWRQPGSAFKPVVYALAFSQPPLADGRPRFTPASTEPNSIRVFKTPQGDWVPRNVSGEYTPTASLAYALAWSQNIATASLLDELGGPAPLVAFARQLGFDASRFPNELGLALGQGEVTPLEMAQFAAIVANGGLQVAGVPVLRAVDSAGAERLAPPAAGKRVMAQEAAALTRELMRLVIDHGTGGAARGAGEEAGYAGPAIGKTGTTDKERDAWFVGASPRYAAAVWVGRDQPESMGAAASDLAAPLWGWWMHRLTRHEGKPPAFPAEPRLNRRWICTETGKLVGDRCQGIEASFLPGTEPKARCGELHEKPEAIETAEGEEPHKYESIWKRMAREKAEREAAQGGEQQAPAP